MANWKEYLEYLNDVSESSKYSKKYQLLLEYLGNVEFYYDAIQFPREENREADGLKLRQMYLDMIGEEDKEFVYQKGCTVYEVLLALSIRADKDYLGDGSGEEMEHLFWEMLGNLGLLDYDDRHFDEGKVGKILRKFMDRKMNSAGLGGLFPLKRRHKDPEKREILRDVDQRKREIWDQMMPYLTENYF